MPLARGRRYDGSVCGASASTAVRTTLLPSADTGYMIHLLLVEGVFALSVAQSAETLSIAQAVARQRSSSTTLGGCRGGGACARDGASGFDDPESKRPV